MSIDYKIVTEGMEISKKDSYVKIYLKTLNDLN